jgi:hypothetical protein
MISVWRQEKKKEKEKLERVQIHAGGVIITSQRYHDQLLVRSRQHPNT